MRVLPYNYDHCASRIFLTHSIDFVLAKETSSNAPDTHPAPSYSGLQLWSMPPTVMNYIVAVATRGPYTLILYSLKCGLPAAMAHFTWQHVGGGVGGWLQGWGKDSAGSWIQACNCSPYMQFCLKEVNSLPWAHYFAQYGCGYQYFCLCTLIKLLPLQEEDAKQSLLCSRRLRCHCQVKTATKCQFLTKVLVVLKLGSEGKFNLAPTSGLIHHW